MLRNIFAVLACFMLLHSSQVRPGPAVDLFEYYPMAKQELMKLVSCRSFYVSQHYRDSETSEYISKNSVAACQPEQEKFLEKVQNSPDRFAFLNKIDILFVRKIDQIRASGLPNGPGPNWARCVTAKMDSSKYVKAESPAEAKAVLDAAYAECLPEEQKALEALVAKVSRSDAEASIKTMKRSFEEGLYQQLQAQRR